MIPQSQNRNQRAIRHHIIVGAIVAAALVLAIAGWARTTTLSGAVIAPGVVVVDSNVKKVQHQTGGIVGQINVRDDDHVNTGDVVVRLEDTQLKANLAVYTKSLNELYARQARLEAERNGSESIRFPADLLTSGENDPEVAEILTGERRLFSLRVDSREGEKAQLRERMAQLREELNGLVEQIGAKSKEIDLVQEELKGVLVLWQKQLIQITRMTALQRDAARLEGERGQLVASKASTGGKISETELQIIHVDDDARSKVAEELNEVRAKIAELSERKIAAQDQLQHVDIRSPQTGRVHQLSIHTIGGVISPGETIMLIVPDADSLSVEAKVSPTDIDELHAGQKAILRFTAFNQRTTPELNGTIRWISADLTQDQRTEKSYYTVRIDVPSGEIGRLHELKIIPGMPVDSFIQTESRTVLSYLLKPLKDQLMRTFRES